VAPGFVIELLEPLGDDIVAAGDVLVDIGLPPGASSDTLGVFLDGVTVPDFLTPVGSATSREGGGLGLSAGTVSGTLRNVAVGFHRVQAEVLAGPPPGIVVISELDFQAIEPPVTETPTMTPLPTATPTDAPSAGSCDGGTRCVQLVPSDDDLATILEALINAEPGDVIVLGEGTYELSGQLSLDVDDVTIRGAGINKTILSFRDQTSGGEGLLVTADNFVLEDLSLLDSQGDLFKIIGCNGVQVRRVRAEWTNGPDTGNGAYGLYPVECQNVLIEDSIVRGASDAGIYVGQSRNIIVRRNLVELNVAGIEIENSMEADVYENTAIHNTGGVLVFNLPGLPVKDGRRTRIFDNLIAENNTMNFAPPGNIVGTTPDGTGALILANDQVEIFGNTFRDNGNTHITIISFRTAMILGGFQSNDPEFDPFSEGIYILDNVYEGGGDMPDPDLGEALLPITGFPVPNIVYDGDEDPDKLVDGVTPDDLRLCIDEDDATFIDLDVQGEFANASKDITPFLCTHDRLPAVVIPGVDEPDLCAGATGRCIELEPSDNDQEEIQSALIEAEPGDVIGLKTGTYQLTGQLSLDVDGVTLRGAGMHRTILSFAGQTSGAEGLLVTADHFTLEDLALEDSPGDLFKIIGADGVAIRRVRAEWTNGPDSSNGSYALYPVQCENVLIENCVVRGASDAGVYVGQSNNIVVRGNLVEENVAGIEIENSTDADVFENTAVGNTGGILVFNLPGPQVQDGRRTRVFDNLIAANNTTNFAPGGIVRAVPDGTGVMILANDQVEIFRNTFRDNGTSHITIISYNTAVLLGDASPPDNEAYDSYSESIFILENTYQGGGDMPDPVLGPVLENLAGGLPLPDLLLDGDDNPDLLVEGMLPDDLRTCIDELAVTLMDIDTAGGFENVSFDLAPYACTLPRLPHVMLPLELATPTPSATPESTQSPTPTPTPAPTKPGGSNETQCAVPPGSGVNIDPSQPSCEFLSSYRLFLGDGSTQEPNEGVLPYDLNTPLFSDYALKHRFVWIPDGGSATYSPSDSFDFPVGSVIVKTFAYPIDFRDLDLGEQLLETRVLLHRESGWVGLPYVWNEDRTEATLRVVGATFPVNWIHTDGSMRQINYRVPNTNQCKGCHDEHDGVFAPLGPKARNLNKDFDYGDGVENQLSRWASFGYLSGAPLDPSEAPRTAVFDDPSSGDLAARARGYMDVNCGNCHNPTGPARTSGLYLTVDVTNSTELGVCKSPVAAGQGSGGLNFDIVPGGPDESILVFRMESVEPGIAMPEIGRQTVHVEALEVIRDWITEMEGSCGVPAMSAAERIDNYLVRR
jgi:parallel beta-helix repeat protein